MRIIITGLILIFISGCSTHSVDRYNPSTDNVVKLRTVDKKLNIGTFTATEPGKTEIGCRAVGPVSTPDGESFEAFIQKALLDELRLADIYAPDSPIIITGNLDHIDFNTIDGIWNIDITVKSSNGTEIKISEAYDYRTAYFAETACANTSNALVPAVQDLISKLIGHSDFQKLIQ